MPANPPPHAESELGAAQKRDHRLGGSGSWNQQLPCSAEAPSPQAAGPETTISFANNTGAPIKIYWVNREGQRQQFGQSIPPGGRMLSMRTFADHVWVATTESDQCLAVFRAYDKLWGNIR